MKQSKQVILFDTSKNFYELMDENDEPTEEKEWDEWAWDEFKNELFQKAKDDSFLLLVGRSSHYGWGNLGSHVGGKVFVSFKEFWGKAIGNHDDYTFENVNGDLIIKGYDHDGVSTYTVKRLTKRGAERVQSYTFKDDRHGHNALVNGHMTKKFFKKVSSLD